MESLRFSFSLMLDMIVDVFVFVVCGVDGL
jgi:hypothetical protein